jgi:RNA polymerase sigma-B factor
MDSRTSSLSLVPALADHLASDRQADTANAPDSTSPDCAASPGTTQRLSEPTSQDPSSPHDGLDCTRLALDHLWLADAISRRFRGRGEDNEDLEQVARCALVEAAHRYDPAQGPFVSYAAPTISGVLKRHFRDHGWVVRPPRRTQQLAVRITQQWSEIAQERGSVPTDSDIANSLDESVATVREARQASQGYRTVPLDTATAPIAGTAREDPGFEQCEVQLLVARTWELLDQQDRELLRMRFWERRSQSDIAARIGTSQMQVSRLLSRVLTRLRYQLGEEVGTAKPTRDSA